MAAKKKKTVRKITAGRGARKTVQPAVLTPKRGPGRPRKTPFTVWVIMRNDDVRAVTADLTSAMVFAVRDAHPVAQTQRKSVLDVLSEMYRINEMPVQMMGTM